MSEVYGVEESVWRKWTFRKLWIYMSRAYDPGTIKKFGNGQDLEAFAVGARRRYERACFVAAMLGEEVPESEKMGQSKLIIGKAPEKRASVSITRG